MKLNATLVFVFTLVALTPGCLTTAATESGFKGCWQWASVSCLEAKFAPPWSEKTVELREMDDLSLSLDGKFAGVRNVRGSGDEERALDDARSAHALGRGDDVIACYELTGAWKLEGKDAHPGRLLLVRSGGASLVLVQAGKTWVRCRTKDVKVNEASTLKEAGVIAGWIPLWVGLVVVDTVLVCSIVGLCIA